MEWQIVRKIIRDLMRVDHVAFPRAHLLTTAHDNDRHILLDGKHYSPLIDSLEDPVKARGLRAVSVARIASAIRGERAWADVRSPEGAFARALVAKRLHGLIGPRGVYPYSRMEERIWGHVLDETGAKRVVGIQPSRELCVAARARGAWVADMQHGVIAQTHPWYGRAFRAHEPTEYLPHAFLVWDPGSAEVLQEWMAPHGVVARIVGNPWISRFLGNRPEDPVVAQLRRNAGNAFPRSGRHNVLVSLSWAEYNIANGIMTPELEAVIRGTQDRFAWHLRLHPNMIRGFATHEGERFWTFFDERLKGLAEWKAATDHPLPLVLSEMDLHVTWSSSVCIEAAHAGIRTCLLDPRNKPGAERDDYYHYYIRTGAVDLVQNDELAIRAWLDAHRLESRHPEDYAAYDREFDAVVDFICT